MSSKKNRKKIKAAVTAEIAKPTNAANSAISVKYVKLSSDYEAPTLQLIDSTDDYVTYGKGNVYPYYLLDLFKHSGLHRSIIEKKVNLLIGNGLQRGEESSDDIIMANRFESVNDVFQKCAYDLEIFGAYYLQVIWETGGAMPSEYYHMPAERMRVGIPNKFGFADKFYYWTKNDELIQGWNDVNDFEEFDTFGENNKTKPQILQVKKYNPGSKYYGSSAYEGALLDIQTYREISNFHNSNLHNGFAPGFMIFFRGEEPSDPQKDALMKQLKDKYSGTENTGKPMVFFLDMGQEAPDVKTLDVSDLDKQFDLLSKSIKENIVINHGIPKQVIGLETAGSLGSSKEILQASMMFRTDYIMPEQNILLKGFNMIDALSGEDTLTVLNPNPNILMFAMVDLIKLLKKNELREFLGYEEDENEEYNEDKNEDKKDKELKEKDDE